MKIKGLPEFLAALRRAGSSKRQLQASQRGAEVIGSRAQQIVVKRTGRLAGSKRIALVPPRTLLSFEQPYAAKIEDRSRFLRRAINEAESEAARAAGRELEPVITVEGWFRG